MKKKLFLFGIVAVLSAVTFINFNTNTSKLALLQLENLELIQTAEAEVWADLPCAHVYWNICRYGDVSFNGTYQYQ